jgi:hypothetical protein
LSVVVAAAERGLAQYLEILLVMKAEVVVREFTERSSVLAGDARTRLDGLYRYESLCARGSEMTGRTVRVPRARNEGVEGAPSRGIRGATRAWMRT